MKINHLSASMRYTGRWTMKEQVAETTAPGAILEIAFKGKACVLLFDVNMNAEPLPHIYIQVDGGAKTETVIDHFVRVEANEIGNHVITMIYKSAMEKQPRWHEPLIGKISFLGIEADEPGGLPEDNRMIIEFIGDSITEGIWVDEQRKPYNFSQKNMVFQNDATATWAFRTAEALGIRPSIMGYGAVGITKGGHGGVPRAIEAYPYVFDKIPAEPSGADIIVINYGANDQRKTAEEYVSGYEEFLDLVRKINPTAKIVALSAFCGAHSAELGEMIKIYNEVKKENVVFIDSSGWIAKEPTHPTREGHRIVSERLTQKLKELFFVDTKQ